MDLYIPHTPSFRSYRIRIRIGIILGLLYFYSRWLVYDNYYCWLDTVNFLIHEAGHPIMGMFGEIIGFLGGTLFQIFIPTVFFIYFLLHRTNVAWQVCLFWVGQNLLNVSIYIADANKLLLPLWDPNGIHDWLYLLEKAKLIPYADSVGNMVFIFGSLLIFIALGFMARDAKNRADIRIGLNL